MPPSAAVHFCLAAGLSLAIGQPARHRGGGLPLTFRIISRGGFPAATITSLSNLPVRLAIARDELRAHPAEKIVNQALCYRDIRILRVAPWLKPRV